MLKEIQVSKNK